MIIDDIFMAYSYMKTMKFYGIEARKKAKRI